MCNCSDNLALLKPFIPIITAFIAVFGVFCAAYISLIQVKKNNVIAARIKWLQDLKKNVSNFITDSYTIMQNIDVKNKRINLNNNYLLIKLNLNHDEDLHNILVKNLDLLLKEIDNFIKNSTEENEKKLISEIEVLSKKVIDISAAILKVEWEVTKSGDINFRNEGERKILRNKAIEKFGPSEAKERENKKM